MKALTALYENRWRTLALLFVVIVAGYALLFHNITGSPAQYSSGEVAAQQSSHSLHTIAHDPLFLPHKVLVWSGLKLGHHSLAVTRVASSLCALVAALLFYAIIRAWYTQRIAVLATILFVCSSSFLGLARSGTPAVLELDSLVLLGAVLAYRYAHTEFIGLVITVVAGTALLYIPGMIWLLAIGLVLGRKYIRRFAIRFRLRHSAGIALVAALVAAPLLWATIQTPRLALDILGLPQTMPATDALIHNTRTLAVLLLYHNSWSAEYWLYGAPLLNGVELLLFITGLFALIRQTKLHLHHFVLGGLVVFGVVSIVNPTVGIPGLLPFIYLTAAGGLFYLLKQWMSVFPRNIFARSAGLVLISTLVAVSVLYHIRSHFVAWPAAPDTRAVYTHKQPS